MDWSSIFTESSKDIDLVVVRCYGSTAHRIEHSWADLELIPPLLICDIHGCLETLRVVKATHHVQLVAHDDTAVEVAGNAHWVGAIIPQRGEDSHRLKLMNHVNCTSLV